MADNTGVAILDDKKDTYDSVEIQRMIYVVRGKQVMMDSDLALLYQIETKNLNKAMKRNHEFQRAVSRSEC